MSRITKAYGVAGVRVYTATLPPTIGAGYLYRQDWIFRHREV